jgi:hypothetical protein
MKASIRRKVFAIASGIRDANANRGLESGSIALVGASDLNSSVKVLKVSGHRPGFRRVPA